MLRIQIPKHHIRDSIDELYMLIDSDMNEPLRKCLIRCYLRHPTFVEKSYSMGFTLLNYAVESNNTFAVELLVMNPAILTKLEERDSDGYSPLRRAIQNENKNILNILIQHNVGISHADMKELLQVKTKALVRDTIPDECSLL